MDKIQCSVGILTFNSSKTLSEALESVKDFNEIVICDGGSTDNTLKIVKQYGCKIILQNEKFKNNNGALIDYAGARNQLLNASSHNWFLFIDSDEYLSQNIVREIKSIVQKDDHTPTAYWMPRKYILDGEVIECASTYPNLQIRFFHKKAVTRFVKKIHERIQVKNDSDIHTLQSLMFVPLEKDVYKLRARWNRYIELEVDRRGDVKFKQLFRVILEAIKVSILYSFRLLRNVLFCQGKKLPVVYEKEYQLYNFRLSWAIFKKMINR